MTDPNNDTTAEHEFDLWKWLEADSAQQREAYRERLALAENALDRSVAHLNRAERYQRRARRYLWAAIVFCVLSMARAAAEVWAWFLS